MNRRALTLPVLAVALTVGVLGVQVANGGGDFVPLRSADPCVERAVTATSPSTIEALGERLVFYGLDGAACRLGTTREALVIELALPGARTDAQIDALRSGLLGAVERMDREGTLPPASALADEALADADLNGFLKRAILALPDSLVNGALKTDDVLTRAVTDLDLRRLLDDLDDPSALQRLVSAAVERSVQDSLKDRLRALLPGF